MRKTDVIPVWMALVAVIVGAAAAGALAEVAATGVAATGAVASGVAAEAAMASAATGVGDDAEETGEGRRVLDGAWADMHAERFVDGPVTKGEFGTYRKREDINHDGRAEFILSSVADRFYVVSADGRYVRRIWVAASGGSKTFVKAVELRGQRCWFAAHERPGFGDGYYGATLFSEEGRPIWRARFEIDELAYQTYVQVEAGDLDGDGASELIVVLYGEREAAEVVGTAAADAAGIEDRGGEADGARDSVDVDGEAADGGGEEDAARAIRVLAILSGDGELLAQQVLPADFMHLLVAAPDEAGRQAMFWFDSQSVRRMYWSPAAVEAGEGAE